MKFQTAIFTFVVLLAGCGREAPPAPGTSDVSAQAGAVAPAAPTVLPPVGDSVLSVSPGSFRACEAKNGAITATAKWDVTSKGVKEVSIYVEAPGNARKLWLNGGATGQSTTDNWVFDHSTFTMVERGTEKPLAQLVINAVPCE